MLKRGLDLLIAIPGVVMAAPLMLVIALAVKLTSEGPVFFHQPRVGQANRIFDVIKFRTMRVGGTDHAGARSASRTDDRITRVGGFLRKTSLDELPQLLNVIFGTMSIVGPRPHALGSTAGARLFWDADARYWQRGVVRPGITGLAQVRGFRGATHLEEDLVNRVQADLDYLLGWSIWRDLRIIFQTAKVLVHPNAY
jgi:lipopolysaccharide/colanic/teichoic acid biosynthesis glycosyltransferase